MTDRTTDQIDALPVNPDAEAATIGSMLIDPDAVTLVSAILKVGDFYRQRDNWIYKAIIDLSSKGDGVNTVDLLDMLERRGQLEEVGAEYLLGLSNRTPTAVYAVQYAEIVRENAIRRKAIASLASLARIAYDSAVPVDELLLQADAAVTELVSMTVSEDKTQTIGDLARAEVERMDQAAQRSAAGLPVNDDLHVKLTMVDRQFGGYQRGRSYVLASRPGMGKSSIALQYAADFANAGHRGIVFSLEMSADQMQRRLMSQNTLIPSDRLRDALIEDDEWLLVMEATDKFTRMPLSINDDAGLTLRKLNAIARREQRINGRIDWIVIDYLQLMTPESNAGNRNEEIASLSRGLKLFARQFNCVVILLSQLSRGVEQRADKRPMLSDLRDSGAIEADADAVDFLYRDDYYDPESDKQNVMEIIRAKSRDGATGTVFTYFRKEVTLIRDLEVKRTELEY